MGGAKKPWINTVHRQHSLRRSPSFDQSLIIQNPQIISEPNNGNPTTIPLGLIRRWVPFKSLLYNLAHFIGGQVRNLRGCCRSCWTGFGSWREIHGREKRVSWIMWENWSGFWWVYEFFDEECWEWGTQNGHVLDLPVWRMRETWRGVMLTRGVWAAG